MSTGHQDWGPLFQPIGACWGKHQFWKAAGWTDRQGQSRGIKRCIWGKFFGILVVLCGPTLRVAHTFNPKNLDLSLRSESVSKSKEMFPPQLLGADWPNQTTCDPYIPSIQWEIEKYICWFLDDCPSQEVVDRWWSIIHTEINFSHNCLPQEVDDRW